MVMTLKNVHNRDLSDDVISVWYKWICRKGLVTIKIQANWFNSLLVGHLESSKLNYLQIDQLGIHKIKLLMSQWKQLLSIDMHMYNR